MLARTKLAQTPITMWALLVWAYKLQKAHLGEGRIRQAGELSATGATLKRLRDWADLGVSIDRSRDTGPAASVSCHDDALAVHGDVTCLGRYSRVLIDAAVIGAPPAWQPFISPLRVGPLLRGNGQPKMEYRNHRPILSLLKYEGTTPELAADMVSFARQVYTQWWAALSVLHDNLAASQPLKRWRVAGIGAPAEPWL